MRKFLGRLLRFVFAGFQVFAIVFAAVGVSLIVLLAIQGAFRKEALREFSRVLRKQPPPAPEPYDEQMARIEAQLAGIERQRQALEEGRANAERVRDLQRDEEEKIRRGETDLARREDDLRTRQEAFRREVVETLTEQEQSYYRDLASRTQQMRTTEAADRLGGLDTKTLLEILRRVPKDFWARLDPLVTQQIEQEIATVDGLILAAPDDKKPPLVTRRQGLQDRLNAVLYLRERERRSEEYAPGQ